MYTVLFTKSPCTEKKKKKGFKSYRLVAPRLCHYLQKKNLHAQDAGFVTHLMGGSSGPVSAILWAVCRVSNTNRKLSQDWGSVSHFPDPWGGELSYPYTPFIPTLAVSWKLCTPRTDQPPPFRRLTPLRAWLGSGLQPRDESRTYGRSNERVASTSPSAWGWMEYSLILRESRK